MSHKVARNRSNTVLYLKKVSDYEQGLEHKIHEIFVSKGFHGFYVELNVIDLQ